MASISRRIAQALQEEFIEGTIYRIDLDRVDVAPAGSSGILHSLLLTGDRDKLKPGDPVKVINVGGERIALAGDVALEVTEAQVGDLPERWRAEVAEMVENRRAEDGSSETTITLDNLLDVDTTTTSPVHGDRLAWNDEIQQWVPASGAEGGLPAHTHPGSEVSSAVAQSLYADEVPWTGVSGKPSAYPPSTHSHLWSQITDRPSGAMLYLLAAPVAIVTAGACNNSTWVAVNTGVLNAELQYAKALYVAGVGTPGADINGDYLMFASGTGGLTSFSVGNNGVRQARAIGILRTDGTYYAQISYKGASASWSGIYMTAYGYFK